MENLLSHLWPIIAVIAAFLLWGIFSNYLDKQSERERIEKERKERNENRLSQLNELKRRGQIHDWKKGSIDDLKKK